MPDTTMPANQLSELAPPNGAVAQPGSQEILRAWIVDGGLQVTMIPAFEDPEVWGVLLADLARHAARAFAAEKTCGEEEALTRIRDMFDAEWERPVDTGTTQAHKSQ